MRLKILLPYKVFAQEEHVRRIVVKTGQGFLGFLPHRLDCTVALTPGILTWESDVGEETTIAVDDGILVKAGLDVMVSVRNAIGGTSLEELHRAVQWDFLHVSEQERSLHITLAKLESGFIRRFVEMQHE